MSMGPSCSTGYRCYLKDHPVALDIGATKICCGCAHSIAPGADSGGCKTKVRKGKTKSCYGSGLLA